MICAGEERLFAKLCATLQRDDLASDPRFSGNAARTDNEPALKSEIERSLTAHGADHWLARLTDAGVPCAPINDVAQVAASPQVAARNMLVTSDGVAMPGNPLKLAGYADPATRPSEPALDQHGAAIRAEFR